MEHYKWILLMLFLFSGVLQIVLSIPLIRGRVRPNALYGLRIKRTLENADLWYAANRYAAWRMLWVGLLLMAFAAVSYFLPITFIVYALTGLIILLGGLGVALFQSLRYVHRWPPDSPTTTSA